LTLCKILFSPNTAVAGALIVSDYRTYIADHAGPIWY